VLVEEGSLEAGGLVVLSPGEAHHLARVLRAAPGDGVTLFDGAGTIATGLLRPGGRGRLAAEVLSVHEAPPPSGTVPAVALGVLHGQAMDWAVQKAVELGVPRFVPVVSERSQPGRNAAGARLEHWRRAGRQALKQCRRAWAMEVAPPRSFDELLRDVAPGEGILADQEGAGPATFGAGGPVMLLVGPEGGFSEAERRALQDAGWPKLRLAEYILRAETAVVAGIALLSGCR